jgi:hypothetical protein
MYRQKDIDNALRVMTVGEAVLDETTENPVTAEWLDAPLNRRVIDAGDRERLGLAPRDACTVLDFSTVGNGEATREI